jgi:hypothetical protein
MAGMTVSDSASPLLEAQALLTTQVTGASAAYSPRAGWVHGSVEDLLLSHGRWFRPAPMPADRPYGAQGECFANATRHAARYSLVYVEGYVLTGGAGAPHAWCAHADSTVEDPTWDIHGQAHLGIPFSERVPV